MSVSKITLGELAKEVDGSIQTGPFGSQLHQSDYQEEGTPVIMPQDIKDDRVSTNSIARISDEMVRKLVRHQLKIGDIIYPRRGDLNKRALITEEQEGWLCGTGCIKIGVFGGFVDSKYLFYFLKQPRIVSQIEQKAVGATMLNLNTKIVSDIEITYPSLPEQKWIAGILSAYDDLIDNNNRRIALLEEAIHRLYREWFVYLRFPGYEQTPIVAGVPEGWEKRPLGEVGFLNYGKSLPKRKREEGTIPVYGSSGIIGTHNKALIPGPSIIVGRKGNVGSAFWCDQPSFPIDTVFYIAPEESNVFLYLNLKHQNFINTDAAVPGLNRNYAHKLPVLMPSESLLLHFEEIAAPVHKQITTLEAYNAKLAEARDALLPRLMNGSLAV
jgi:type I restriction enzyme, S subunit